MSLFRTALKMRSMSSTAAAAASNESLVKCGFSGDGGLIATLTFNNPDKLNALTIPMAEAFINQVEMLKEKKEIRAMVLTGSGKAFSAGGDLDWLIERHKVSDDQSGNAQTMINFYKSFLRLRTLPFPIIGAINGPAIGAGMCVALGGTDIRIASPRAKMGFNFTRLGLHPGMAATHFLPLTVGPAVAADLLLTGRILNAEEAADIGLVNKVCDDPVEEAIKIANEIAFNTSPSAVTECLKTIRNRQEQGLEESLKRESEAQAITYATKDFLEGVVALKEKRKPRFSGN